MMSSHPPIGFPLPDGDGRLDLPSQIPGTGPVCLVHDVHIGRFHHARLERLDAVARFGNQYQRRGVGHRGHRELGLAHPDSLDQDPLEPCRVQHVAHFPGAGGETAQRPASRHRSDIDAFIEGHRLHPDPVSQQGSTRERAGRVHRHDGDPLLLKPPLPHQLLGQGGLAGSRRPGDSDPPGSAELSMEAGQQLLEPGTSVLHDGDGPGQCGRASGFEGLEQFFILHK